MPRATQPGRRAVDVGLGAADWQFASELGHASAIFAVAVDPGDACVYTSTVDRCVLRWTRHPDIAGHWVHTVLLHGEAEAGGAGRGGAPRGWGGSGHGTKMVDFISLIMAKVG